MITNVIKYWTIIKIPTILIENKNAVAKESKKILKMEIFSLLYALIKILILIYVDKFQANKKGTSLGLKKPWPSK